MTARISRVAKLETTLLAESDGVDCLVMHTTCPEAESAALRSAREKAGWLGLPLYVVKTPVPRGAQDRYQVLVPADTPILASQCEDDQLIAALIETLRSKVQSAGNSLTCEAGT